MSNLSPKVTVMLDKERHLYYDLNALIHLEEHTGKEMGDLLSHRSMKEFRAMIWEGLRHEDSSLTEEQVGSMLHPGNISMLKDAMEQAYASSQPDPKEGEPKNEESPPPGETSGPTDA